MKGRSRSRPRIGIALGSGSARGWAHIGVLRALQAARIEPEIVCGTSIGALVGGAYASGQLDKLEVWARSIRWLDVVRLLDVNLTRGGFIQGAKIFEAFRTMQPDARIEDLPKAFAAVATDFVSGREVWLQAGSLREAVRASTALPGVFPPAKVGEQWLVDGGLVNPVPVSVCRALGAEVVIAVNLNGDLTSRNNPPLHAEAMRQPASITNLSARLRAQLRGTTGRLASRLRRKTGETPGLLEVLAGALYIMQDRITRSRLAGDPPDIALTPCLGHIRLLDFDCGDEAIAEGSACVEAALAAIERAVAQG